MLARYGLTMEESTSDRKPVRRGRRPGKPDSRKAILEAARARFAQRGFAGTTIRGIAADAGVDPALVMQFYRSKSELFMEVMSIPPEDSVQVLESFLGPEEEVGEQVARAFLEPWEPDRETSAPLLAMLRGANTNDDAAIQLRDFLQARLLEGAERKSTAGPDTMMRAGLAATMLVGVVFGRRVLAIPVIAEADLETIIATVAPAVQRVLVPVPADDPSSGDASTGSGTDSDGTSAREGQQE